MDIISTQNLSKRYKKNMVVNDVSITVKQGDIYGLVGRNGAGKTTLLRMITGVAIPTSGKVSINGATSGKAIEAERSKIGSIIDQPAFFPKLSAFQNFKAMALQQGCKDNEKLRDILKSLDLNPDDKKMAKNFSLGMKQRLAIGIALLSDPSLLILDEPVNGLDPTGIYEIRELLFRLNKQNGVTILISSHLLTELGKLATCYGVMDKGKLIKELRDGDLDALTRPYIKVVVGDLKSAVDAIKNHFSPQDFEILPYNTIAVYNLEKGVPGVAAILSDASVPVLSISQCAGDAETAFINLMGGIENEKTK